MGQICDAVSCPNEVTAPHASLISLDVAETPSDPLCCGHPRLSADGIATPMRGLNTQRPFAETAERTGDKLADRWCRSLKRARQECLHVSLASGDEMRGGRHQQESARSGPLRVPLLGCQPAPCRSTRSHGHPIRRIRDGPQWHAKTLGRRP